MFFKGVECSYGGGWGVVGLGRGWGGLVFIDFFLIFVGNVIRRFTVVIVAILCVVVVVIIFIWIAWSSGVIVSIIGVVTLFVVGVSVSWSVTCVSEVVVLGFSGV